MKKLFICLLSTALITTGCSSKSGTLTLKGDIENNIISANSTVAGKIIEMKKEQGQPVKKGEVIAVIDNTNQKYTVEGLQAVVNMKKAKLEELKSGTRPEQIEQAEAQARAAKAQVDLLTSGNRAEQIGQAKNTVSISEEALNSTKLTYDHINTQYNNVLKLYQVGAVSKSELDDAKYKLDTTSKQLSTVQYQLESSKQQLALLQNGSTPQEIDKARANYDAAEAQVNLLKSGATKEAIEAAQGDLDQTIAQLNQAENNLNNCSIVALADGIIVSKNFQLGDIVNVGSNIADIAIKDDLYLLCYIPDEYLGKVYYNQPLTVKTSIGTQTGKISYIALKNEYTPKDKQSTSEGKHIATKIKITIKDNKGILKSGMTGEAQIPLK
ncbi:HlyD family efflux transporter periplasmic adaptor subunit [Clostridium sp. A1-XYC3]|uniref:HlyD family efflux transporter periplasmic adaptor subunit n=1 Tax=Clostridium tanneri TaxID=3037988 RepID=A0ABU4JVD3_9CLOT|nr:HlyD family efflux transporter periplasmic adaptor subunit [Clostridium sp. A1-XYC3]MDW8802114.1 HlyD family efflux transporter periplasmic adaptor subunit [Clostridium sp. A1-XYC3]